MFQLSKNEWNEVITICDNLPENVKYSPATPFAFTEQGTSMLSAVLRSNVAIQVSIAIMRAFVMMRHYLVSAATVTAELAEIRAKLVLLERNDNDNLKAINDLSEDLRKDIDVLYTAIEAMAARPAVEEHPRRRIGYRMAGEND